MSLGEGPKGAYQESAPLLARGGELFRGNRLHNLARQLRDRRLWQLFEPEPVQRGMADRAGRLDGINSTLDNSIGDAVAEFRYRFSPGESGHAMVCPYGATNCQCRVVAFSVRCAGGA